MPLVDFFSLVQLSWIEARIYNELAIGAAPRELKHVILERIAAVEAAESKSTPLLDGMQQALVPSSRFRCGSTTLAFDLTTGALNVTLAGQEWTNLLRYSYVTYAEDETWDP
eukprot:SAG31_NODE_16091_length_723_cov_1.174679_1_plen_111_part_01